MTIDPKIEALARAMCLAMDRNPDKQVAGDMYPPIGRNQDFSEATMDTPFRSRVGLDHQVYVPQWQHYAWDAHKWIFEASKGRLPR